MKGVCLSFALLGLGASLTTGCGGGNNPAPASSTTPLIQIATQPQDQSVPMGLTATYSVATTAYNPQYQWLKNGTPIPGATGMTYTTPATAFSDTGTTYSVQVTYSGINLTSRSALLTVTARAVKAGDLRFGQVDAPATINGFQQKQELFSNSGCVTPGIGLYDSAATGSPLILQNNNCLFQLNMYGLPSGISGIGTGTSSLPPQLYPGALYDASRWAPWPSPTDPGSVIESLNIQQTAVAFTYTHSVTATGFDPISHTVAEASLQDAVTQEGQHGRVVTAVSDDGSQATYYSYGWTGAPSTLFETKVVFATLNTAGDAATGLANQGYIITASSGATTYGGSRIVLVGTRVQGDTMARPILIGSSTYGATGLTSDTTTLPLQKGYAVVALVQEADASGNITGYLVIGER